MSQVGYGAIGAVAATQHDARARFGAAISSARGRPSIVGRCTPSTGSRRRSVAGAGEGQGGLARLAARFCSLDTTAQESLSTHALAWWRTGGSAAGGLEAWCAVCPRFASRSHVESYKES
jgi:hypothetical protein